MFEYQKMITINKKDPEFHAIRHCLKAVGKDPHRANLLYLCSDEKNLVATNGYRLNLAEKQEGWRIGNGLYFPAKNTPSEIWLSLLPEGDMVYPSYQNIFPSGMDFKRITCAVGHKPSSGFVQLIRYMHPEDGLDFEMFKDLDWGEWEFCIFGKHDPIVGTKHNLKVLLMPMRAQ